MSDRQRTSDEWTAMTEERDRFKEFAEHRMSHNDCRCCLEEVTDELETAQQEIARLKSLVGDMVRVMCPGTL